MSDDILKLDLQIEGLDEFMKSLTDDVIVKAVKRGAQKGIQHTLNQATMLAPKRQEAGGGDLQRSIKERVKVEPDEIVAEVYTENEYAIYNEFGTGQRAIENPPESASELDISYSLDWAGMKPTPFLYPSINATEDLFTNEVVKEINKEL